MWALSTPCLPCKIANAPTLKMPAAVSLDVMERGGEYADGAGALASRQETVCNSWLRRQGMLALVPLRARSE